MHRRSFASRSHTFQRTFAWPHSCIPSCIFRFPYFLRRVYRQRLNSVVVHSLSTSKALFSWFQHDERNKVYLSSRRSLGSVSLFFFFPLLLYPSLRDSFRRYSAARRLLIQSRSPFNLCVRVSRLANGRSLNRSHATSGRRSGGFMSLRYPRARRDLLSEENERSREQVRSFCSIRDDDSNCRCHHRSGEDIETAGFA